MSQPTGPITAQQSSQSINQSLPQSIVLEMSASQDNTGPMNEEHSPTADDIPSNIVIETIDFDEFYQTYLKCDETSEMTPTHEIWILSTSPDTFLQSGMVDLQGVSHCESSSQAHGNEQGVEGDDDDNLEEDLLASPETFFDVVANDCATKSLCDDAGLIIPNPSMSTSSSPTRKMFPAESNNKNNNDTIDGNLDKDLTVSKDTDDDMVGDGHKEKDNIVTDMPEDSDCPYNNTGFFVSINSSASISSALKMLPLESSNDDDGINTDYEESVDVSTPKKVTKTKTGKKMKKSIRNVNIHPKRKITTQRSILKSTFVDNDYEDCNGKSKLDEDLLFSEEDDDDDSNNTINLNDEESRDVATPIEPKKVSKVKAKTAKKKASKRSGIVQRKTARRSIESSTVDNDDDDLLMAYGEQVYEENSIEDEKIEEPAYVSETLASSSHENDYGKLKQVYRKLLKANRKLTEDKNTLTRSFENSLEELKNDKKHPQATIKRLRKELEYCRQDRKQLNRSLIETLVEKESLKRKLREYEEVDEYGIGKQRPFDLSNVL